MLPYQLPSLWYNWKKLCHPDNVFGDSFFSLSSTDKCYLWEEDIAQWPGYELVSVSLSGKKNCWYHCEVQHIYTYKRYVSKKKKEMDTSLTDL